jgi:hypothetical protein
MISIRLISLMGSHDRSEDRIFSPPETKISSIVELDSLDMELNKFSMVK